jgi:ribonuclease III
MGPRGKEVEREVDGSAALAGESLPALEEELEYSFRDKDLLLEAITHRSLLNELAEGGRKDNERLEFLGDSILGMIISEWIMQSFPEEKEGELTRLRSSLVKEKRLAEVASGLGLGSYLHLGKGEERMGGRQKPSVLADAFESMVGAIYLDGGLSAAQRFVQGRFRPFLESMQRNRFMLADPKTRLQELLLALFRTPPTYRVASEEGPDHQKTFCVDLAIHDLLLACGKGKSKKEAEQDAAEQFLKKMERNPLGLL